jgi:hypothetical protein
VTALRGVCAGGMTHQVGLIEVGGFLDPTDVLYISQPDVLSGLVSPDSEGNEGDHVSQEHCPDNETNGSDALSCSTERANAVDDIIDIKDGSGLATGGDPHDPKERQPGNLNGKLGCEGTIAEETKDEHWGNGAQVEDSGSDTEGGVGKKGVRDLAQCVYRETKDDGREDVARAENEGSNERKGRHCGCRRERLP